MPNDETVRHDLEKALCKFLDGTRGSFLATIGGKEDHSWKPGSVVSSNFFDEETGDERTFRYKVVLVPCE